MKQARSGVCPPSDECGLVALWKPRVWPIEDRASLTASQARRSTSSYLTVRQSRSAKTSSRHAPRPSMLMATSTFLSTLMKPVLVNRLP